MNNQVTISDELTIIIISYNSEEILSKCLASILESPQSRTIIIDNASPDQSADKLAEKFPRIEVIPLPQNIGYGRAANVGLIKVETPYALLINPDLKVSAEDIEKLFVYARDDDMNTAIWGPRTERTTNSLPQDSQQSVEWISGCAMLFDMQKMKKVGLFDENIFLFFEETDLCTRVINAGFKIRHCQSVFFDHMKGVGSTPNPNIEALKDWHYSWSRCYYFSKHEPQNLKRTPESQHAQYRRKALYSLTPKKRRSYRLKAKGAKAFLTGIRAFDETGLPFIPAVT